MTTPFATFVAACVAAATSASDESEPALRTVFTVARTVPAILRALRVFDGFVDDCATFPPCGASAEDRLQVAEVVVVAAPDVHHGAVHARRR